MDIIRNLLDDSKKGFILDQSVTFREQHVDDTTAEEARRVVSEVADHTRFHVLMALHRDRPLIYEEVPAEVRARILAAALAHVAWLNDFGYLDPAGSWDDIAAHALVGTGMAARQPLNELLGDTRPAPLRGSEAGTMSHGYAYRRCDFAYRYLSLILGADPTFVVDIAERDRLIANLRARAGQIAR